MLACAWLKVMVSSEAIAHNVPLSGFTPSKPGTLRVFVVSSISSHIKVSTRIIPDERVVLLRCGDGGSGGDPHGRN